MPTFLKRYEIPLLSLVLIGCGGGQPSAVAVPASQAAEPMPIAANPAREDAGGAHEDPGKVLPLSPEQKKKADALLALERDRAKMDQDHRAELARWNPGLHSEVKALAETNFPSARAAILAVTKGKHRKPASASRDVYRHPVEMLTFFGFKPTMTVLEYGPGEGWYTELLAPALAKQGKLLATNTDPNGPKDERSTFYGQRYKLFLETSPEAYGKVQTVIVDPKAPTLSLNESVDMVVIFRGVHGMVNAGKFETWLSEFHKALKPKGILAVEQHRAKPEENPIESAKHGYVPESWVISKIEEAGFKLEGKSEMNANPKDTKDHPEGVWTLPPTFRLGDKDREKYSAIGESDRMTLKFVKRPKGEAKP